MRNFPRLSNNTLDFIILRLKKKAAQSRSKYRISAIAFDERGDFVAQAFNGLPPDGVEGKPGIGVHAEEKLIHKFKNKIKIILISRIGNSNDWRPIRACNRCSKLAEKYGIRIITINECKS